MLGVVVACEEHQLLPVLVKIAVNHAVKGMAVTIITHSIGNENDLRNIYDVLQPHHTVDVLERITFRYSSTTDDILRYCHSVPVSGSGPHVVLINGIETYCDPADFVSVKVCSAIMDAVASNFRAGYIFNFFVGIKKATLQKDLVLFKFLPRHISTEAALLLP